MGKNIWTYFNLTCDYSIQVAYMITADKKIKVTIKSGIPKTLYYMYLNEAEKEAIEHYNINHSSTEINQLGELVKI